MINAINSNMFITPPTMSSNSIGSALQVAVDNTSIVSMAISEGGFTEQGLAFLALLALFDTEDNPLNLAQRMILLSLLLSMSEQEQSINVSNINMSSLEGSIPTVGYNALGGTIIPTAPTGVLFSGSI